MVPFFFEILGIESTSITSRRDAGTVIGSGGRVEERRRERV